MPNPINYCSAPCGSGKTYAMIKYDCHLARWGNRVLDVKPTTDLCGKTVEQQLLTRPWYPEYKVFHGKTVSGSVSHDIIEYYKCGSEIDESIVFSTHQVLPRLDFLAEKEKIRLNIDEEMQVHQCNTYRVKRTHHHLTKHLELEAHDDIYSRLVVTDEEAIKEIAINKDKDDLWNKLRGVAQLLDNRHWDSYVKTELYKSLLEGEYKTLSVHSILNPSVVEGFGSVTMASALFEDSMIYQLWKKMGVDFVKDERLSKGLRFQEHENGGLVTIKFADEALWSRSRRKSKVNAEEPRVILDEINVAAQREFEGKEFLVHANLDVPDKIFGGNATRIPSVPHGLNDYSNIHNILFLSSLNPPPEHFRFMKKVFGIEGEELRRAIYCASVYQAVMRTSIRDPNNENEKVVIVPDLAAAEYLHEVFPGSNIDRLETSIPIRVSGRGAGRPRIHASGNERVAHHRQEKARKELVDVVKALDDPYVIQGMEEIDGELCNEMGIDVIKDYVTSLTTTAWYRDKTTRKNEGYLNFGDVDWFISLLELWHEEEVSSKKDRFLISPAIFNKDGKKLQNIEFMRHIWLDFEKGDLEPEEIPQILSGIRLIVMSTFSHRKEKPRFRVFIPTSRRMTVQAYRYIWDWIASKIERAGYWVKERHDGARPSGLDRSARSPHTLFYAPCRAKGSMDAFFNDYAGEMLDPLALIENGESLPESVSVPYAGIEAAPIGGRETIDPGSVEAAIQRWRSVLPGMETQASSN
jgi:hypothetical protein